MRRAVFQRSRLSASEKKRGRFTAWRRTLETFDTLDECCGEILRSRPPADRGDAFALIEYWTDRLLANSSVNRRRSRRPFVFAIADILSAFRKMSTKHDRVPLEGLDAEAGRLRWCADAHNKLTAGAQTCYTPARHRRRPHEKTIQAPGT
jgi:hypothetical protein